MGFGGISIWQLLIVLAIIVLLFGTKKLRNLGGDLGSAVKSFKGAMKEGEAEQTFKADPPALDDEAREDAASSEKSSETKDKA